MGLDVATAAPPYLSAAPRSLGPSSRRTPLTITEIMYNPAGTTTRSLEYIELFNTEPVARDVSGFALTGSANFTFPSNTVIAARNFLVVARDPTALAAHGGLTNVLGPLDAELPNDEGTVRLRNKQGAIVLAVAYADTAPWPKAPDGTGHSLVLARPDLGEAEPEAWTWSAWRGGSPGDVDPAVSDPRDGIVINEYLAHTDLPQVDFIELFNTTTQQIDVSLCTLSDQPATNRFTLPPGSVIAPRGFLAFLQPQLGFSLSKSGSDIFLRNPPDTRVLDAIRFGAKANGVSSGRYPDGTPDLHELTTPTAGTTNAPLRIRDIVINEIMFHPISGDDADAYVELFNRGTGTVDVSRWQLQKAITFTIPPSTFIPPGGFLVIAPDATNLIARYPQLTSANTVGNYAGTLSDRGERLVLAMPDDPLFPDLDLVTVDEVTYDDGWGPWTDGDGSSLELIDPRSDNRRASNWAGSSETNKSTWTSFETTGTLANSIAANNTLNVFLMGAGECLLDDVQVVVGGTNRISNSGFQSNTSGWTFQGAHIRTSHEMAEGYQSTRSLHLRASAPGSANNRVEATLSAAPVDGQFVTIRAKARWLAGWPILVLALNGGGMEAAGTLTLPVTLGSPGLINSCAVTNGPPAIDDLAHAPVLPGVLQPVVVSCRVHDPDGLTSVTLNYRLDPSPAYVSVAMNDAGTGGDRIARDGTYSGTIPGQVGNTMVAFYVDARDNGVPQAARTAPALAPTREALVRFGSAIEPGVLGTYNVWITQATLATWNTRDLYSNEPLPLTFVYGNHRAVYDGGIRYRGNSRVFDGPTSYAPANDSKTPNQARGAFHVEVNKHDRVLGADELKLDSLGQIGRQYTLQGERHCYWIAEQLGIPYVYPRLIHLRINESDRGALEDLQTPARDFAESWSPTHVAPRLYKLDQGSALDNITRDGVKAASRYRAIWVPSRTEQPRDDFSSLYPLIDAFNSVSNTIYEARVGALIDLEDWLGYVAVNHIVGNEDSWGYFYSHNAYLEATPGHRARLFMYDMDWSLGFTSAGYDDSIFHCQQAEIARLLAYPPFTRMYWRFMQAAIEGPLSASRSDPVMDAWYSALVTNHAHVAYRSTTAPPYTPDQPSPSTGLSLRSFVTGRRTYLNTQLAALSVPFAITNNNGNNYSTLARQTTLMGRAPVTVATVRINGIEQRVAYPSVTTWETTIGLKQGANVLQVEGVDRYGSLVGSDSITVTSSFATPSPAGKIILNEIHYHPSVPGAEFVEIVNRSASDTFDLAGWRLNGVDLVIKGGTIIGPGQYRVAVQDLQVYAVAYTNVELSVGRYDGSLDDGGENLQLLRPLGGDSWDVIDEVRYDNQPPWPAASDGQGYSLQLLDPDLDNRRPGSWAAATNAGLAAFTPGAPNSVLMDIPPFAELWINEIMPTNGGVTVDNLSEADPWIELLNTGTGVVDLAAAQLYLTDDLSQLNRWAFPPGWVMQAGSRLLVWADGETSQTAPDFLHAGIGLSGSTGVVALVQNHDGHPYILDAIFYAGLAPGQSLGSYPEGDAQNRQIFHQPTPGAVNNPTSQTVRVRINEWLAENRRTLEDPTGGWDDWFELFNDSPDLVNLGGFHLTDDLTRTNQFTIPGGTAIPGYGFLLVWADENTATNAPGVDLHANFRLKAGGEALGLFAPDGTLVDALSFGVQADDVSEGRWPDGETDVHIMAFPTPKASNQVLRVGALAVQAGQDTVLQWLGKSGTVYRVEFTSNLTATAWLPLASTTGSASIIEYRDAAAAGLTQRFYRIRW